MNATYRGKPIKEMTRSELEDAIIFLQELNRKLAEASERRGIAERSDVK